MHIVSRIKIKLSKFVRKTNKSIWIFPKNIQQLITVDSTGRNIKYQACRASCGLLDRT